MRYIAAGLRVSGITLATAARASGPGRRPAFSLAFAAELFRRRIDAGRERALVAG